MEAKTKVVEVSFSAASQSTGTAKLEVPAEWTDEQIASYVSQEEIEPEAWEQDYYETETESIREVARESGDFLAWESA